MELFKLLGTIAIDNAKARQAIDETSSKSQAMASKLNSFFGQIGSAYKKMFEGGKGKEAAKSFDEVSSATEEQREKLNKLKAEYKNLYMQQGKNSSETKKVAEEIEKLSKEINKNEKDLDEASKAADKYDKSLKDLDGTAEKTGSKLGSVFSKIGKGAAVCGKAIATGLAAGATACVGLATAAIKSYSEYEQLVGGVETLFGTRGAKSVEEYAKLVGKSVKDVEAEFGMLQQAQSDVMENAANAYKTAGLSANAYMETANGLAAALNQSSASQLESAALADQAIIDMADNANKMGTSMEAIQTAYAGFSKQNYTMLDNLKLGYGGTKEEMQRLLDDAGKIANTKFDISSFADVTQAIHVMQEEMGIAGTTAKEATETIQGSLGMMKGAWSNLMTGLSDPEADLDKLIGNVFEGVTVFAQNLIPRVSQVLSGIATAFTKLVPMITSEIPNLLNQVLPPLIEGAVALVDGLVSAMPSIISAITAALPALIQGVLQLVTSLALALPQIIQPILTALPQIIQSIIDMLPVLIPALIQGAVQLIVMLCQSLPQIIQPIIENLPMIITTVVSALIENLPALIMGLIQLVLGIVAAIPQIFQALYIELPAALWKGIFDGLGKAFSGLGAWFGETFSGAKDAAVKAWSNAKEKWNNIKEKCVEGFSNLKDKVGTKFNEAKTKAQEKWNDAKEKFGKVKDKVVSAFDNLKDKVSPLFSKAKDNATQTWSTVKGSFEKIKQGDIVGAFSDLGSLLKGKFSGALTTAKQGFSKAASIGKDLVSGLWNGITNKFSWLTGKIKGFAKNVTDKLKSFFGIKSPSRVFRDEIGKQLAEGVAVGVTANSDKAESAVEKMGKNILDAAQKRLDGYKVYNDLTLADEVAFWDSVRSQVKEGTDARISADQKYMDAKKALNEKVLDAETSLQKKLDEIGQKIVDRQKSIMDSFDLFSEFEVDEVVKPYEMIEILDTQVDALEQYQGIMSSLKDKIGDTALYEELESMGVGALNKAGAINAMSDYQLNNYVDKFEKMSQLAGNIAKDQLAEETLAETQTAFEEFADAFGVAGVEIIDETTGMKLAVEDMLASMKTAFESFEPKMKMPHFSISGSLDIETGEVPSVAVEWYKKAMNNAMLLNKPTIFGYDAASGKYLGGGEAGSEVVAGSQTLMNMIQAAVSEQNNTLTYYMQKIIEILANYFPQLLEGLDRPISFDPVAAAGAMAVPMNDALGRLSSRKDRGR